MAKKKIKKNLTDADMLKAFMANQPKESVEDKTQNQGLVKKRVVAREYTPKEQSRNEFYREFLTEKVQTQIGKTLLAIKMEYYREGVSDFSLQVRKDGKNIILETAPKKVR